jgi:hypothetical protein
MLQTKCNIYAEQDKSFNDRYTESTAGYLKSNEIMHGELE